MSASSTAPANALLFPPSALPEMLPIFPLAGAVLLPHARLPLNVFETRYVAMIEDALTHPARLIGMVQPSHSEPPNYTQAQGAQDNAIYKIGCAGRITSFTETEDGRYLVTLTGICRFAIAAELPLERLYRRVRPDWQNFLPDISPADDSEIDQARLLGVLKNYFKIQGIAADWEALQTTPVDMLVSSLVMICPLATNEKQALLEAPDLAARADLLTALLEMANLPQSENEGGARH